MLDHLNAPAPGRPTKAKHGGGRGRRLRVTSEVSMIEYSLLFAAIASLLVLVFFALGSYVTGALSTPCGPTASVTQTSTACPVR